MKSLFTLAVLTAASLGPQIERSSILDRSPSDWPPVKESSWSEWDVAAAPPAALRPDLARVVRAYDLGDLPGTLAALYDVLDRAPDFPPALHQTGLVYFKLQRYGDSIAALERYLEVAPHRVGDTRHLAHSLYSLGRYDEAVAHYDRVLGVHPASLEARLGRGLGHMRLGMTELALADLALVLETDPSHVEAILWTARIHFDEERLGPALAAAGRARDLAPFDHRPSFLQSRILFELGRDDEAEAASARFERLSQLSQEVRAIEGRLLYRPQQPVLHRRLVELHRAAGSLNAAGDALRRWLRLQPDSLEIRIAMLDLAIEAGDQESAKVVARSLRQRGKDHPDARAALARWAERLPPERNGDGR